MREVIVFDSMVINGDHPAPPGEVHGLTTKFAPPDPKWITAQNLGPGGDNGSPTELLGSNVMGTISDPGEARQKPDGGVSRAYAYSPPWSTIKVTESNLK